MMKFKQLLTLLPLVSLASCIHNQHPDIKAAITTDTLTYSYKTVKQKADDCGNKPDKGCTIAFFKYPHFDNAGNLNDSVVTKLAMLVDSRRGIAGIQQLVWAFMNDYKDYKQKNKASATPFELTSKVNVLRQDSSLTTVVLTGYLFEGGAHGNSVTRYLNWNTKASKKLTLDDLFKSGYQPQLTVIAEKIFRKEENLDATASLSRDYFFKGGKFSLNDNYLVTPIGIDFLYNVGEIKPYAAGTTTITIPYAQLSKLLQPGTVAAQYVH